MKIRFLGAHNCESSTTRLVSLLIDDVLAIDAGGLTSALSFARQRRVKSVLLTHHHYDHVRDIPALAMNAYLRGQTVDIYSIPAVYDVLATHLLNDEVYPDYFSRPPDKPAVRFTAVQPGEHFRVLDYNVVAAPVNHSIAAVGYQLKAPGGQAMFFTGDAGPGLADCWKQVSPKLLIIEVTASNKYEEFAVTARHLTPKLLQVDLESFRKMKGYLPRVVAVHMNPAEEKTIAAELGEVAGALDVPITLAHEGMVLHL